MIPHNELPRVIRFIEDRQWNGGRQGSWGKLNGRLLFKGTELQTCKMKRILDMDSGGGYTTMCMHLMTLNWTLKNG